MIDAVRDICGVQAQVMSAAEIALWARVRNLRRDDVERALSRDRSLVKTRCMRATVHLLPAAEVSVLQAGMRRSVSARIFDRWIDRHGLAVEANAMTDAIVEALSGGPLTRKELTEEVVARLGSTARQWGEGGWGSVRRSYVPGWMLAHLCLQGLLCFGPNRGAEATFVRLRTWVPTVKEVSTDLAEATLLRLYLRSYGPATLQDFVTWAGLAMGDAKRIRAALGEDAVEVDVEGSPRLVLSDDRDALVGARTATPVVRLLPSFDPYLLGHRNKDHLVAAANYKRVYRSQGWLSPVVLVDGRAVGVWSHHRKGDRVGITIEAFGKIPAPIRSQVEAEAGDLGRFLEAAAEVTFA